MVELTAYEQRALRDIESFKTPRESSLGALWRRMSAPVEQVSDLALGTVPGAAVVRAVQEVLDVINDGATWTVRTGAIYEEFRRRGLGPIDGPRDVRKLGLHEIDRLVTALGPKYQAIGVVEGASSGLLGGVGIAADVALVVGLALRAVGEYATYYGFDVSPPPERAFVMSLLSAASTPTPSERGAALGELTKLSVLLAGGEGGDQLESQRSLQLTKKVAEALTVRVVKAKLGQLVPIAGAVIAGGYNAWLMRAVTATAYHLFRERFLLEKHGEEILARRES
jgi:hypothetical protein